MTWIFLLTLLWGAFHSLLASEASKDFFNVKLGEHVRRYYRIAYNVFASLSFLPVLWTFFVIPDTVLYRVPSPFVWIMIVGQLLAVFLLYVGIRQTNPRELLGLSQMTDREGVKSSLVTSGLYRYVRHPLYSAGLLFLWLMPLMTRNILAFTTAISIYVFIGALFEERRLRATFGFEYIEYMKKTPMLIPFIKRNKTPI